MVAGFSAFGTSIGGSPSSVDGAAGRLSLGSYTTSGAIGFDTLAAREVIKFRLTHNDVKLILCLPCQNQDEKWNDYQRWAYDHTLISADEIIYARDSYSEGCMRERNFLLANKCDILIAYCGRANSGASQTIRMAEAMGKDVFNIYRSLEIQENER